MNRPGGRIAGTRHIVTSRQPRSNRASSSITASLLPAWTSAETLTNPSVVRAPGATWDTPSADASASHTGSTWSVATKTLRCSTATPVGQSVRRASAHQAGGSWGADIGGPVSSDGPTTGQA